MELSKSTFSDNISMISFLTVDKKSEMSEVESLWFGACDAKGVYIANGGDTIGLFVLSFWKYIASEGDKIDWGKNGFCGIDPSSSSIICFGGQKCLILVLDCIGDDK